MRFYSYLTESRTKEISWNDFLDIADSNYNEALH